jgi:hypothetical protein
MSDDGRPEIAFNRIPPFHCIPETLFKGKKSNPLDDTDNLTYNQNQTDFQAGDGDFRHMAGFPANVFRSVASGNLRLIRVQ